MILICPSKVFNRMADILDECKHILVDNNLIDLTPVSNNKQFEKITSKD